MPNPQICPECEREAVIIYGLGTCAECSADQINDTSTLAKPLFKRFTRLKVDTLLVTKTLMNGFYRLSGPAQFQRMEHWLSDVSSIYGIDTPTLALGTEEEAHGSGVYLVREQKIILPKCSIVSLMHEFRHHMQSSEAAPVGRSLNAIEDDARAWSLSLFYAVKPKLFEKSVREGKIFYVNPEDLDAN